MSYDTYLDDPVYDPFNGAGVETPGRNVPATPVSESEETPKKRKTRKAKTKGQIDIKTETKPDPETEYDTTKQPTTNQTYGEWTPEKRRLICDRILTIGIGGLNYEALVQETGLTHQQLRNALQRGRGGNLRDKLLKAAES